MNASILGGLTFAPSSVGEILSHLHAHPSCFDVSTQPPVVGCGGGGGAESCYLVHATPWCRDEQCCVTVCAFDPFCCHSSWDSLCVQGAAERCGTCGIGYESCTVAHSTPGCWLSSCCGTVCSVDPFCCESLWDSLCAQRASANCQTGETCVQAIPISTGVPTGVLSGPFVGDNDGRCDFTTNKPRWYRWIAPSTGMMTVRICGGELSTFPYSIELHRECGGQADGCRTDANGDSSCTEGFGTVFSFAVNALENIRIRVAMRADIPILDGVLTVTFAPYPLCGLPTAGSCVLPHPNTGCADGACCVQICALDPFCCTDFWDALCVTAARSTCGYSPADLNGDGAVSAADLSVLLDNWGDSLIGDINEDSVVNAADLSLLLAAWGS